MNDRFKSRKLLVAATMVIFTMTMIVLGHAQFAEGADFMKWILGIYVAGNVSQKYTRHNLTDSRPQ